MPNYLNILITGAAFLLFFLLLINPKKANINGNRWFASFIFCLFVLTSIVVLINTKAISEKSIIREVDLVFIFLIAPLFYLSIQYFIKPNGKWSKRQCLHFGSAFLFLFLFILSFLTNKENPKNPDLPQSTIDWVNYLLCTILSFQVYCYCALGYKKIIKHQKNILIHRSSVENINLNWLKNICIAVSIMGFFWAIDLIFRLSENYFLFDFFTSLLVLLIILYITYFWFQQEEIYPYSPEEKKAINALMKETNVLEEKKKKPVSDEDLEKIKTELLVLMENEKPFLDSEISLVKLSKKINVSAHQLSYIINNGFDANFFQFINSYRIKEAQKLILDSRMNHLSFLGIGFEVGFNSKTVFNTTFKKVTGKTPSEFKKCSSDL
ncbi:MAG: Transcriptional regulator, AraC family [Bacteroidota bacterium]|nr:Transcriptional regulator, AraC family [Bacteroidota bacterium]